MASITDLAPCWDLSSTLCMYDHPGLPLTWHSLGVCMYSSTTQSTSLSLCQMVQHWTAVGHPHWIASMYFDPSDCLGALLNQLHSVRARWYKIGLQLGIPYSTLDCLKQNYSNQSDLMCEMLKHWLQTAVKPYPAWEVVFTALRSPAVNESYLAEQLESKHCTPQQPRVSMSTRALPKQRKVKVHIAISTNARL